MQKVITLYKKISQTPLELLRSFQEISPEYKQAKMAYAGRLDPMAHGLMLYLVGNECKKRDKYQNLNKTYQFDLILGIETDTHDCLGMITNTNTERPNSVEQIRAVIAELPGEFEQEYPAFSSKTIDGVPMFQLAKEGRLKGQKIPSKKVRIHSAQIIDDSAVSSSELVKMVKERIKNVSGEFRQKEIIEFWEKNFQNTDIELKVYKIEINAISGTYMRSIADSIGKQLGTYAIAFDILRTKIDNYKLSDVENYQDYLESYNGIFTHS